MIDSAPMVVPFAVDLRENIIDMPFPFRIRAALLDPFSSNIRGKRRVEPMPPISDNFMTHIEPALVQKIFRNSETRAGTGDKASPLDG